jgi:hypothetical protein
MLPQLKKQRWCHNCQPSAPHNALDYAVESADVNPNGSKPGNTQASFTNATISPV